MHLSWRSRRRRPTADSLRLTASWHFRLQVADWRLQIDPDGQQRCRVAWSAGVVRLLASEEPVQTIQSEGNQGNQGQSPYFPRPGERQAGYLRLSWRSRRRRPTADSLRLAAVRISDCRLQSADWRERDTRDTAYAGLKASSRLLAAEPAVMQPVERGGGHLPGFAEVLKNVPCLLVGPEVVGKLGFRT